MSNEQIPLVFCNPNDAGVELEEFFANIHNKPADAAMVRFCSTREEDVENMLRLDVNTGPLPVLTCSKTLNPDFIRKAARRGAARFLVCNMAAEKTRDIIHDAIRDEGLIFSSSV